MSKKKLSNTNMRRAYYEAEDKIPNLKQQAQVIQDEELLKIAIDIEKKLRKYYEVLERKYLWD